MDTYTENLQYYSEKESHTFSSLRSGLWVLLVAILGSYMAFIDSTAIKTTLPIVVTGLGIGVAISPMVSAVMGLVNKNYSGLAYGVNNAVRRVAINNFNIGLERHLIDIPLDTGARHFLDAEKTKLAGAHIPNWLGSEVSSKLSFSIKSVFLSSFRIVMILCAVVSFLGTVITYFMIDDSKIDLE